MKRFSLLVLVCVVMVCVVCSCAMGAYKMNTRKFAEFCRNASAQEVRNVLKSGAEMDDDAWFNAAAYNPNVEVLKVLINEAKKYGVNLINKTHVGGRTALMEAARTNPNPAVVKFLIEAGENVKARDASGDGAVRLARLSQRFNNAPRRDEVIKILLNAGARDEEAIPGGGISISIP